MKLIEEQLAALMVGETTFYAIWKRQQARAEKLTNVTPVPTPFMELITKETTKCD